MPDDPLEMEIDAGGFWQAPKLFSQRYLAYLKSEAWQKKRAIVIKRANGKCERCLEPCTSFEVHHLTYRRLGREWLKDLKAVCKKCHEIEDRERRVRNAAKRFRRRFWKKR